jgi:hypothetical protein
VLDELSKDAVWYVRESVAKNKNTPTKTLARLSNDKNVAMSSQAKTNLKNKEVTK